MSQVKFILAAALILSGCTRGRAKEKETQVKSPPAVVDPAPADQRSDSTSSQNNSPNDTRMGQPMPPGPRPQPRIPASPIERVPNIKPNVDPYPPLPEIDSDKKGEPTLIQPPMQVIPDRRGEAKPDPKTMLAEMLDDADLAACIAQKAQSAVRELAFFDDSAAGRTAYIKNVLQAVGLSLEDVDELSFTRLSEGLKDLPPEQFHMSRVPGMRWAFLNNGMLILRWDPFDNGGGFVSSRVLSPEEVEIVEWQLVTAAGQETASFVRCVP